MLRVLQVVNIMDRAGLETMLMNYYRNIDRTKLQFDFLTHRSDMGAYEEEILSMGGRVYRAPRLYPQNFFKYYSYMKSFFFEHPEISIVHSHIDAMSFFPLFTAKINGIPVRIGHSHSTRIDKDFRYPIKFVARKLLPLVANKYAACGEAAGAFMYPKNSFKIIRNAINLENFSFDVGVRLSMRKKLGFTDEFVIGHIGRFNYVKNQLFLLEIFKNILNIKKNSRLLLIGKGEDEKKIREKADKLNIADKVIILIDKSDIQNYYQVFDAFVMPSLFEGVPVVGIEAQANGLPCFFSDSISDEVTITNNVKFISLRCSALKWSEIILSSSLNRNMNAWDELACGGYDIKIEAEKLQQWYFNEINNTKKDTL